MEQYTILHAAGPARAQAVARRVHGVERPETERVTYAGLVTRVIAFALDALIINGVAIIVAGVVGLVVSILPATHVPKEVSVVIGGAAWVLWLIGYFIFFWTTTGQTPGNRLLGIKVERGDGSKFRPRHALARLVGMVLSAPLLIGFLPILVTERRRGLPDWMAGTVVTLTSGSQRS